MSVEYNEIRRQAVAVAINESRRPLAQLIETGMENRGTAIDEYLNSAGVHARTMNDPSVRGAENRMWCGCFVYFCYLRAARGRRLPFDGSHLWGGRGLTHWAKAHTSTIVEPDSRIFPGDIFVTWGNHIGMAAGESDANNVFATIEGNQGDLSTTHRPGIARRTINAKRCSVIIRI